MEDLIAKLPSWAINALAVIGALRVFFKPIMSAIEAAAKETQSSKDDLIVEKVKSNAIYRAVVWVVDLLASVKLPVQK